MGGPPEVEKLRATLEGSIGSITLAGPHERNRLDLEMALGLEQLVEWFAEQTEVRALVLRGEGGDFSGGGIMTSEPIDVDSGPTVSERVRDEVVTGVSALSRTVMQLRRLPYPTVASLDGLVAGGGLSLALACEMRIASERARFFFAYGSLGAIPDGGITQTLPEAVGPRRALSMLLEDKLIRAERALDEGLIDQVVPDAELDAVTLNRAKLLAAKPPHYLAAAKRLLHEQGNEELERQIALELSEWERALETEDLARGVVAQLEGRTPSFEGR